MKDGPLTKRRRALLTRSLDEDVGMGWSQADLANLQHDATVAEAQRDGELRREGEALLAAYLTDDDEEASWQDLLRRFMDDLRDKP